MPVSANGSAMSLPFRVWSIRFPSSEWSPGPYTPPGCTITIGAPCLFVDTPLEAARSSLPRLRALLAGPPGRAHRGAAVEEALHDVSADDARSSRREGLHEPEAYPWQPPLACLDLKRGNRLRRG